MRSLLYITSHFSLAAFKTLSLFLTFDNLFIILSHYGFFFFTHLFYAVLGFLDLNVHSLSQTWKVFSHVTLNKLFGCFSLYYSFSFFHVSESVKQCNVNKMLVPSTQQRLNDISHYYYFINIILLIFFRFLRDRTSSHHPIHLSQHCGVHSWGVEVREELTHVIRTCLYVKHLLSSILHVLVLD